MNCRKISLKTLVIALCSAGALASAQETVLYSFNLQDGDARSPTGGLVMDSKGNLYGTAENGGKSSAGAVFELSKGTDGAWTEKVLYSFFGSTDGISPRAVMVLDEKGNLYGTTYLGGNYNAGTVFELIPQAGGNWGEKVLFSFDETLSDGFEPAGGVILDAKGNLYGATSGGGSEGQGMIYELVPGAGEAWTETVLFTFTNAASEGSYPFGELVFDGSGNLYGTASQGGTHTFGNVFELSPQAGGGWQQRVLYNFGDAVGDGDLPAAGLIFDHDGNLYGTTYGGGAKCGTGKNLNCGTVFELSPAAGETWTEKVLRSFGMDSSDAVDPESKVVLDREGNLYGTTGFGGAANLGTIYEVVHSTTGLWSGKILHSFLNNRIDGYNPESGLTIDPSGNLYGTTGPGGEWSAGTVYEFADPDRTEAPVFSVASGTYTSDRTVTITDGTQGALIYFTTNGDDPTTSSTKYSEPIKVDESETIKAIAVAKNLSNSEIATGKYTIETPAAAPEFSLKPATYTSIQVLSMSDKTGNARIFYATVPSTPLNAWKLYSGPIHVLSTETVKAYATAIDHTQSSVTSETYTIQLPPAATPVFYPMSGTYKAGRVIVISDKSSGTTIYYTTDGTMPTTSSARYPSAGIVVDHSETIRAIAAGGDYSKSPVASAAYVVPGTP